MSVDGTWNISIQTPLGERKAAVVFKTDGAKLSARDKNLYDGTVNGDDVSWKTHITDPISMTLEFKGKVSGDAISGTVATNLGTWMFSGTRG